MEKYADLITLNWTMAMILVTVLVLYLILKHFFFEKVHNFMLARQNAIVDAFDNADHVNKLADEKLEGYNRQISNIEAEGRELIREAKQKADRQAQEILKEAVDRAAQVRMQADAEIQREKLKAVSDMKLYISSLALYAAEKVVERELDEKKHIQFINQIIEEAGTSKWQS
ncbi:MAG: F0F1 ATP synthase subunit B [Anaerovorax sp.]